ncbi:MULTISPECIES: hypothetical protein [unclassified Streptosporangium]|uniref:hypothetical protein n=1 Tax=unclassified Streptosporangium TaxID=2632669 RepID=UPI002E2D3DAF|nr:MULTISPECIES: hypothetical protein [unclassified Streptosporangium]
MSTPTGTGRLTPGPGQGAAWVREHGAHLMDYAASHLEPGRAHAAVVSALVAGRAEAAPGGVTARGRLLAALRRDCRTSPGYRERYVPGSGPGMPEASLIERVWTIVDPLGTETLRLTYRHALGMEDLSHVLAMPVDEVARLATRTQDLIETLVSGLDALAHGRRTCPDLAPLVETVFPGVFPDGLAGGRAASAPADPGGAQASLLSHMIRCSVCTRPINIRYTVPQMISHPPVAPLSAEERQRLTDSLPPEVAREAAAGVAPEVIPPARPARGGSPVLSAPPGGGRSPVLPAPPPGGRTAAPPGHRSPTPPATPAPPAVALPAPRVGTPPYPPVASKPPAKPPAATPSSTASGAVAPGDGPAAPANPSGLPPLPALPPRRTRPSRPPSAPPVPGHDTPLYDALLTQAWAREVLAQSEELTGTIPRQEPPAPKPVARAEPVVIAGQASVEMRDTGVREAGVREAEVHDDAQVPALRFHTEPDDRPDEERIEMGIRVLEALSWAGARIRNTTIKIVIIVVAGAAGTLTGMNLLGPAIEPEEPARSLQASTSQATRSPPSAAAGAPARQDGLASRLRVPPVVTLDEFGLGSMVLTISGEPLKWRISAPGLAVTPSSGTLREGVTQVINLRAHRVRNWCGAPASVTAPMTVHGLDDSISTTVRWRTC